MALIPPIALGLLYTIQAGGRAFFIYAWLFMAAVTIVRHQPFCCAMGNVLEVVCAVQQVYRTGPL